MNAQDRQKEIAEYLGKMTEGEWQRDGLTVFTLHRVPDHHRLVNRWTASFSKSNYGGWAIPDEELLANADGTSRLRSDAPWLLARIEALEGALRNVIACSTCAGSGKYVFECNGCLAGPPVPHESWCGTPEVCPACDGTGHYADNADALANAESVLKGEEGV